MSFNATVASSAEVFQLGVDEVRLWWFDVAELRSLLPACEALLATEELARMSRLRAGVPREEFVLGRACLRALLAIALGTNPREIKLSVSGNGKPHLPSIEFNVAHSRGQLWIALSRSAAVGIDVERVDRTIESMDIAEKNFTDLERASLEAAAPGEARARTFFRIWTRKEAVVKAHGGGLLLPLAAIETSVEGSEGAVRFVDNDGSAHQYFVRDLDAGHGFAAALAVETDGLALTIEKLTHSGFRGLLGV